MSRKFTIITEGGSKIEMSSNMDIVIEINKKNYEISIKEI